MADVGRIIGKCKCGGVIWDVKHLSQIPSYFEKIVCPNCGADCSRRPSLLFRYRYARYRVRKWRSIYGRWSLLTHLSPDMFRLPRELDDKRNVTLGRVE